MSATPARHRAERKRQLGFEQRFWSARGLVEGEGRGDLARHARKAPPNYAPHIGRVGALAVSLGVGLAIANSSGVAYADTDANSSASRSGDDSASAGPAKPSEPADESDQTTADDADDVEEDGEAPADEPQENESDEDAGDPVGDKTPDRDSGSQGDPDEAPAAGENDPPAPPSDTEETSGAVPLPESSAPPREPDLPESVDETTAVTVDIEAVAAPEVAPVERVETVNLVSALVSNAVSPLVDPQAPAVSPITDWLLGYIRRLIDQTFFTKTPVYGPITPKQNVLGQLYIDLNAEDPNGGPLEYDVVEAPEHGWVYRDLITGDLVYTPWKLVTGQPLTDSFEVVVRDEPINLPGVLGDIQRTLHGIARFLGLAQVDHVTVTVPVVVQPVIQYPPLVTPIAGPGYKIGRPPVNLVSAVSIVDGDTDKLSKAVLTVTTFGRDGDVLGYVAQEGIPITSTWDAASRALTLSGEATLSQYETAIGAVTFSATQGALLVRSVTISVTDADGVENIAPGWVPVGVWPETSLPPLVTPFAGPGYILRHPPANLVSSVSIVDGDSNQLSKAVLTVTTFGRDGDVLAFTPAPGSPITSTWNAATRTLTLSGVATLGQYEDAIRAVTFSATQGPLLVRSVTISVTDVEGIENIAPGWVPVGVRQSSVPLVTPWGARSYTIGGNPQRPVASVSIADADADYLSAAEIAVTTFGRDGDMLRFNGLPGVPITATYNASTRTMYMTGRATKSQYEQALEAITFTATQGAWTTRSILINVTDEWGTRSADGWLTLSVW
jgi:uncharacterized lipoprotein NlpE involved in copper resistance